ncbi:hypothetical protein [Haladaptatus sp. DFWS20]|uniref:hypothetical protein n=1 Tax=Haladaptatus sp. DFWS20 TaxID=3403467 RepID=UPI003EBEE71A
MDGRKVAQLTGIVGGVVGVTTSYAIGGRTPAFVGAGAERAITTLVPGVVMTTAIQYLGNTAQTLTFALALLVTLTLFSGVTFAAVLANERSAVPYTGVVVAGVGGWILATLLTGGFGKALVVGGTMSVVLLFAEREWHVGRRRPTSPSRRSVLATFAGVTGFSFFAFLRGRRITGVKEGPISTVTSDEVQKKRNGA